MDRYAKQRIFLGQEADARLREAKVVLVGLGVFQRLSATVEEKVGDDDEAEEAREEGRPPPGRKPATSKAGRARR